MMRQLLKDNGMDEDVIDYATGALDSQVPAMASGSIDGAVLVEPALSQVIAEDIGYSVYSFSEMMEGYSTAHLAMKDDFIAENEELVTGFQRALNKALDFIHNNK